MNYLVLLFFELTLLFFFFFKQKTAYEMRISDWSSDVCSSDLKPISQKPAEVRMGNGKGNPEYWVAEIQPGKVLYEMEGVSEEIAREAFRLAAAKLPIGTTFVSRHIGD